MPMSCPCQVHVVTVTAHNVWRSPSLHDCQCGTTASPASFFIDRVALLPRVITIDMLLQTYIDLVYPSQQSRVVSTLLLECFLIDVYHMQ